MGRGILEAALVMTESFSVERVDDECPDVSRFYHEAGNTLQCPSPWLPRCPDSRTTQAGRLLLPLL